MWAAWAGAWLLVAACSGRGSEIPKREPVSAAPVSTSTIGTDFCDKELACDPEDFETNYGGPTCVNCNVRARCIVAHDQLTVNPDCGDAYRAFLECMVRVDCDDFKRADDEKGPCEKQSDKAAACLFPE